MAKVRIAIQNKGRLYDDSMNLLEGAGVRFTGNGKRKLLTSAYNFPIEALFLRDDDIPQAVADGVADIAIVGENEVLEKKKKVEVVKSLGFSKCRLSLAIPKSEAYEKPDYFNGKTIATSYPAILQDWLSENNVNAEIHVITGSVEVAPAINLADAIFDIVSSGSTLVSNGLKEVHVITSSEALLIANENLTDEKRKILDEFVFRIEAVQQAEDKKYIMLNCPKDKLNEILTLLPGMKSPTVTSLAEENWYSVQSVIKEADMWNVIVKLKQMGAQNILVLPIDKMIL